MAGAIGTIVDVPAAFGGSSIAARPSIGARWPAVLLGLRLTPAGILTLCVLALIGASAVTSEVNLLLLVFGIGLGVVGFNAVSVLRSVHGVTVERIVPDAAVAGRPFQVAYLVRSRRRWFRVWGLRVGEVPATRGEPPLACGLVLCLPAGGDQRIELQTAHPHRGRLSLRGIRLSCGFPFGLCQCVVDLPLLAEIVVYPMLGRMRKDLWSRLSSVDPRMSRKTDPSRGQDEFHGVREYRAGDNPRWIHWRRSAHAGHLIVREHVPIRETQLIILLDPFPSDAPAPVAAGRGILGRLAWARETAVHDPVAERVISAAATAACDALDHGHRVGLICRSTLPIVVAPAGGRPHRRRLLHEMAVIAPGAPQGLDELLSGVRWSSGWYARCLLFTPHLEDAQRRALRLLGGRTESLTVVSPESGWLEKLFDLASPPIADRRSR